MSEEVRCEAVVRSCLWFSEAERALRGIEVNN